MLLNHSVDVENVNNFLETLDVFHQFAFVATFDTNDWETFIGERDSLESAQPQTLNSTQHTNYAPHSHHGNHSNHGDHVDGGHGNHGNTTGHSDDTAYYQDDDHSNAYPHDDSHSNHGDQQKDGYYHTDGASGHTNGHGNDYSHYDNGSSGGHWNTHQDSSDHNNYTAHGEYHYQINYHTDDTNHSNSGGHWDHSNHTNHSDHSDGGHSNHSDYSDHDDTGGHSHHSNHSDYGFDHDNYVPSTPVLYNADGTMYGLATIGIYSYDANQHGLGTQTSIAQIVKYDLSIRKVRNLDGISSTSSWHTLLNQASMDANGGITHVLDTIDPLGTGNTDPKATEGYYELRVISRNDSQNGVTYISDTMVQEIKIQQNRPPEIAVQNGGEFIDFIFGFEGAVDPADIYQIYENIYAGESDREGVFVKFTMRDPDSENWQKGQLVLKDSNATTIATRPLYWGPSSGTVNDSMRPTVVKSSGSHIEGYGYIPAAVFGVLDDANGKIVVEVSDYYDEACTDPAGATTVQQAISLTDSTLLRVGLDTAAPVVTADDNNTNWRQNATITLTYDGGASGIEIAEYQVTNDATAPTTWETYTGPITLDATGIWYIHYRGVDKNGNEVVNYLLPYHIDQALPSLGVTQEGLESSDNIRLHLVATDDDSGVGEITIQYPDSSIHALYTAAVDAFDNTISLSHDVLNSGTYVVTITDKVGNSRSFNVQVNNEPRVIGFRLIDVVAPPTGTDVTLSDSTTWVHYPVATPTRIKAGYELTFEIDIKNADSLNVDLFKNGHVDQIVMIENGAMVSDMSWLVPSRQAETIRFKFWVDKNTPLGDILSLEIEAMKDMTSTTDRIVLDQSIGANFAEIVGSALEDTESSQTK